MKLTDFARVDDKLFTLFVSFDGESWYWRELGGVSVELEKLARSQHRRFYVVSPGRYSHLSECP
ncbi:MAG: hypothetical protein E6R04_01190 [Spirochaetes bacterium]|nr:MAG: hypothetical protein E6R04_01190 [Spirochaetota bacterium]